MLNCIKRIYLNLILLNTYFVAFLFNYSSITYDQVFAISVVLLPFEILYLVCLLFGIKNKKIRIFNIIVFLIILFVIIFNRIKKN